MPSILITLESGVSLAFIVIERMDSMLMHIRKQIREEVDELVPQQFRFISIWGPPISQVQEAKMAVRDALHDGKKLVVRNYDDKRNLKRKAEEFEESDKASEDGPTPPKASPQAKRPLQSTLTPPAKQPVQSTLTKLFSVPPNSLNTSEETTLSSCESASDHEQKTEEKEIVKKSAAFSSPSSKLDLFTYDEISNNPCWLERERRKHWNLKVHLSASKQCMTYDKVELLGIIDTDWTLKKAELLQIRVFELQVMHDSLETVYDRHPLPPPKTISDNQELVSKLLFCIKNENSKLMNITSKTVKAQAEERLHDYLRDLKRASDALFKALNSREVSLMRFKAEQLEEEPSEAAVLTVEEENEIALNVCLERDEN